MAGITANPIVASVVCLAAVAFIAWDSLRGMPQAHAASGPVATGVADGAAPPGPIARLHAHGVAGTCGVLILALALACDRFAPDRRFLIVGLLAVSATCLACIAAYYELTARRARFWRGHWPAVGLAAPALVAGTAAVSFVLYPMIYPQPRAVPPAPLPPSRPFSITPGWGVYAPSGGSGLSDLAMIGQYEAGVGIQPINWLVHVSVANNRSVPTTIMGIWASAAKFPSSGGAPQWQQFCNVTSHLQRLFRLYPSLSDATEYSTVDALDAHLVDQSIPAHGSVSGWLAWYCPARDCGTQAKLTIREANGEVSDTGLFPLSSTAANLHDALPDPLADHVDLTTMPLALVDSCERPGTSGLMVLMPHN